MKRFTLIFTNIGVMVALLVALDLGAFATLRSLPVLSQIARTGTIRALIDERAFSKVYPDPDKAFEIFTDFEEMETEYSPYTVWRHRELQTQWINVDAKGNRKTCGSQTGGKKVFMFGGSTLFGTGVADCDTIPSYLAQHQQFKGQKLEIVNFGTTGYQSTQELIRLMVELQAGNIPDFVVFYDGVNDTYAGAYSPQVPGYHQNYDLVLNKFEQNFFLRLVKDSNLFAFMLYLNERFGKRHAGMENVQLDKNARETVHVYRENLKMLKSLSKAYGFKYLAIWQPVLLASEKPKTEKEEQISGGSGSLNQVYQAVYQAINKSSFNRYSFRNLSKVFDQTSEETYIDFNHIGPAGNKRVAGEIAKALATL